jgi:hypothetical protein
LGAGDGAIEGTMADYPDPHRTFVWVEPPAARPEKPGARCPCAAGLPPAMGLRWLRHLPGS